MYVKLSQQICEIMKVKEMRLPRSARGLSGELKRRAKPMSAILTRPRSGPSPITRMLAGFRSLGHKIQLTNSSEKPMKVILTRPRSGPSPITGMLAGFRYLGHKIHLTNPSEQTHVGNLDPSPLQALTHHKDVGWLQVPGSQNTFNQPIRETQEGNLDPHCDWLQVPGVQTVLWIRWISY
jgi:hypothetical protein